MPIDLRLNNSFFVSKDIFSDSKINRRVRAVYIALCYLLTLQKDISLAMLAEVCRYNIQITNRTLKELEALGFITRSKDKTLIGITK